MEYAVDALRQEADVERRSFLELVDQFCCTLNWAGHQFRKEGDKEAIMDEFSLGFKVPTVDIDGVTDGLEGVEADAKRQ